MPTKDRRPRRRLKAPDALDVDIEALLEEARIATPSDWDNGLRRRFVRGLVAKGKTTEIAAGIVRAFELRAELIPLGPPR